MFDNVQAFIFQTQQSVGETLTKPQLSVILVPEGSEELAAPPEDMMTEGVESATFICGSSTVTVYADGRIVFSGKTLVVNGELQVGVTSGEARFEQEPLWKHR